MLHHLRFALGFALSAFVATTGSAFAAFDPTRDELMGIMAAVVGILIGFLTLVYAVKWYMGWDRQPARNPDLEAYEARSHH
jgi:membrane protein DedA with SNARE-associated domain